MHLTFRGLPWIYRLDERWDGPSGHHTKTIKKYIYKHLKVAVFVLALENWNLLVAIVANWPTTSYEFWTCNSVNYPSQLTILQIAKIKLKKKVKHSWRAILTNMWVSGPLVRSLIFRGFFFLQIFHFLKNLFIFLSVWSS